MIRGRGGLLTLVSNVPRPWVYILNPVGTFTKGRLTDSLAGHPAGTEISAPYAKLTWDTHLIDIAKTFKAKEYHWSKGHPITAEDIPGWASELNQSNGFYLILNPVGVPARVRLLRPFEGLPTGTEISWDNR